MIIVGLILLGLCFGSFTNALTWRLHEQAKPKKKRVAADKDLSITTGRSMCPNCQHPLAWYDLLPVVSWLSLGGKCRYCKHPISIQYPLVELLTAALFILSYAYSPPIFHVPYSIFLFSLWLIFQVAFVALAIYDLRWMILPDRIIFPLQVLAVIYVLVELLGSRQGWPVIQGALLGVLCIAGVFYGLFQVSKGTWIGGGDVKLAVILGLLVGGPAKALLVIFIASLLGSLVSIPLLLRGKAKTRIPFGPFLIIATVIVYLFGSSLIAWYKHHLLRV